MYIQHRMLFFCITWGLYFIRIYTWQLKANWQIVWKALQALVPLNHFYRTYIPSIESYVLYIYDEYWYNELKIRDPFIPYVILVQYLELQMNYISNWMNHFQCTNSNRFQWFTTPYVEWLRSIISSTILNMINYIVADFDSLQSSQYIDFECFH